MSVYFSFSFRTLLFVFFYYWRAVMCHFAEVFPSFLLKAFFISEVLPRCIHFFFFFSYLFYLIYFSTNGFFYPSFLFLFEPILLALDCTRHSLSPFTKNKIIWSVKRKALILIVLTHLIIVLPIWYCVRFKENQKASSSFFFSFFFSCGIIDLPNLQNTSRRMLFYTISGYTPQW